MVAAYRDPVMRQWLRRLVTTGDEARAIIQARRADWAAETGFSFAVLVAEPGVPGDLVGSVSIRGLDDAGVHASCRVAQKTGFAFSAVLPPLLPDFPDDGHLHIRLAGSCAQQ
jgi:hypothetical protein